MADVFTKKKRSDIMSRIRSRGNYATELQFIRMMRKHRISGWRRGSQLPGKPDFLFPRQRLAVFIDGDFWHGNPRKFRIPKTNYKYWSSKIDNNRKRDRHINRVLKKEGWKVLRFWGSSLGDVEAVMARLKLSL
jgi:DNA mismatch endonuclease (patch repair protein)